MRGGHDSLVIMVLQICRGDGNISFLYWESEDECVKFWWDSDTQYYCESLLTPSQP